MFTVFLRHPISVSFSENPENELQFFLTLFWQNIFVKEMWMDVKSGAMKPVSGWTTLWYTLYRSPKKSVSFYDIARFAVRLSPFRGLKSTISHSNIGHFACRNGAFRKAMKCPSNINYWFSILYKSLLFSAYLRPKEGLLANTRLFFGVEQETWAEKSESAYNLKVTCIVFI